MSPVVNVHEGLVAHHEGSNDLQGWNLQGEIEGGDEADRTVRPPHPVTHLPSVIPRHSERPRRESHLHIHLS